MSFLFLFRSQFHRIIPIPFQHCIPSPIFLSHLFPFPLIPIPIPGDDYIQTALKPRNMYIVSWIQNKISSYSRSIVNQTHHSSVIIIGWLRSTVGGMPVFGRRTETVLRSTFRGRVTTMWVNQPTWPIQPFILSGSINE